jgi:mRNA interferase RelE/StbE
VEIRFSKSALRSLLRSNKAALIRSKIAELASDPESQTPNVKRLQGREECRLRVQDWRVIFRVSEDVLFIDAIGPRGSIY